MSPEEIAIAIVRLVKQQGGAFIFQMKAEIGEAAFEDFLLCSGEIPNMVLWTACSQDFVAGFGMAFPYLVMRRAAPLTLAFFSDDEGIPPFPIIGMNMEIPDPEKKYWFPAVFFLKESGK